MELVIAGIVFIIWLGFFILYIESGDNKFPPEDYA